MTWQSAPRRGLELTTQIALIALSFTIALIAPVAADPAAALSLYGSHESLVRQNLVAQQHDYAYLRTTQDVVQAVESGTLVAVHGNEDFQLALGEVSFHYARPQVKTFLEQLSSAYHAACGEPLVVTSLVRPISRQPWNASPISVHPTGMAVDLRRSDRRGCRQWLESTLLALEGEGMIEAIRERFPPHYHVAVFPDPLLLPGPIGDPNGVVRVVALAALHGGTPSEPEGSFADNEPVARHGRVHLGRSARTGRYRITQTAVARRTQRARQAGRSSAASTDNGIDIRRSRHGARHGQQARGGRQGRQQQAGAVANASAKVAAKHRSAARSHSRARSRASSRTTTSAAR